MGPTRSTRTYTLGPYTTVCPAYRAASAPFPPADAVDGDGPGDRGGDGQPHEPPGGAGAAASGDGPQLEEAGGNHRPAHRHQPQAPGPDRDRAAQNGIAHV